MLSRLAASLDSSRKDVLLPTALSSNIKLKKCPTSKDSMLEMRSSQTQETRENKAVLRPSSDSEPGMVCTF